MCQDASRLKTKKTIAYDAAIETIELMVAASCPMILPMRCSRDLGRSGSAKGTEMVMHAIRNRWTDAVLFECDVPDDIDSGMRTRHVLEKAVESRANLSGANLSDANLSGANLSGANLSGAYLSRAYLSGAYLSGANLSDANLSDANLSDANLSDAHLSGANLSGANLSRANLSGANLSDANLSGAHLSGANLSDANLSDAKLSRAYLSGAHLSGANLSDANLSGANLSGAYLSRAYLSGANLSDANLSGANLSGANLSGAKGAESAIARTRILPEGDLIGWKKCAHGVIVKLRIPVGAKRSHAFGRKCRAEFADVLEVFGADVGIAQHDGATKYAAGQRVTPHKFDENWQEECTGGIHFFITRIEAEEY